MVIGGKKCSKVTRYLKHAHTHTDIFVDEANPTKLLKITSIKAETNHLMRKTNVNIKDSSLWVNDENEKWISQKMG